MPRPRAMLAMTAAVALSAAAAQADPVRPGEETGLGLVGGSVPEVLKEAKAQPYAPPEGQSCEAIKAEIASLDAVLGPDADTPPEKVGMTHRAGSLFKGVIKGFIPHRSIVRMVTGADAKDKERTDAAMAGWARRGYLKGLEAQLGCPGSTAAPAPPPAVADAQEKRAEQAAATAPKPVVLPDIPVQQASATQDALPAQADAPEMAAATRPQPVSDPAPVLVRSFAPTDLGGGDATLSR